MKNELELKINNTKHKIVKSKPVNLIYEKT